MPKGLKLFLTLALLAIALFFLTRAFKMKILKDNDFNDAKTDVPAVNTTAAGSERPSGRYANSAETGTPAGVETASLPRDSGQNQQRETGPRQDTATPPARQARKVSPAGAPLPDAASSSAPRVFGKPLVGAAAKNAGDSLLASVLDAGTNEAEAPAPVNADTAATRKELDALMESAKDEKADARLAANLALPAKIITEEEKKVVTEWQKEKIVEHQENMQKDYSRYFSSLEYQVIGKWAMGDSGSIVFYKDGTGEVKFRQDDKKEETLRGNFYFRYSFSENILNIIPILTVESHRRITCHFIAKHKQDALTIGPYHYRSVEIN
jgi:hypothetical protein